MKTLFLFLFTNFSLAQVNLTVGGGCDGCELMFIDMPEKISSTSYSPAWNSVGQKLLITGRILKTDGTSPAANVLVYYWQTDSKGYYSVNDSMNKKTKKHGYIRGWVKSDSQGNYKIFTIKPKSYPNRDLPAHIHLSIKEPEISEEYYVDKLLFDYDPLLTTKKRKKLENRGGSGILRTLISDNMLVAEHNIILGLNIPNYPIGEPHLNSGQAIGEDFHSITPYHAWGPDIGTTTCPVCRYGRYLGIMYFVSNIKSQTVKNWLLFLENKSQIYGQHLKVYLIYGNEENYSFEQRNNELATLGQELGLKRLALTFVSSFKDKQSDIYKTRINPNLKNTFILYKNRNIIAKFINLDANDKNFMKLTTVLNDNQNDYFNLPIDTSR
ncbi:MAG: hypothetical protein JKX98_01040 [Alcanivoracaceae bacterium]|nr:hypothetical protein [Alcanivoracaceae bacterium]